MPYKSSSIKLSEKQDRRRKLTSEQKEEIKSIYEKGNSSWQSLADKYHVSKKTIGLIVSDVAKETQRQHNKECWRKYQQKGEKWAKVMREHRHYKQELYKKGELESNQK